MPSVFISYNKNDKSFANKLAEALRNNGIEVWIDEDGLKIGDSLTQRIPEAIKENDYVAAVISRSSISSRWVQKELALAIKQEISGKKVKVLPIRLDDCEMPESLEDKLYADFANTDEFDNSFLKILNAIGISKETSNKKEIDRDGSFIAYDNGVVYDAKTDLEWFAGPDKDTDWYEAADWVRNLDVDGGEWRFPTQSELESLHEEEKGTHNITPLLKTACLDGWSTRIEGSKNAHLFQFDKGLCDFDKCTTSAGARAFAVRSRRNQ